MSTKTKTKTNGGTRETGRAKRVFGNVPECAHRWAANTQTAGECGNVFFDSGTIYSYGRHFPIARHVRRGNVSFVLFTTRTYSNSTARHKSIVLRALRGQTVYAVDNVLADASEAHAENVRAAGRVAAKLAEQASRARSRRSWLAAGASKLIDSANMYAFAVGIRTRLPALEAIPAWDAKQSAAAERQANRRKEEQRRALAADMAKWEQELAAWRDGGPPLRRCPSPVHPLSGLSFLRVRGTRLETSQRVVVSLDAARPLLELVRSGAAMGGDVLTSSDELAAMPAVDGFRVRRIDPAARILDIGCHSITYEEIERAAAAAGI